MKTTIAAFALLASFALFAGCSPAETDAAPGADAAGKSDSGSAAGSQPAGAEAAMATCGFCGQEFPKAELTEHDGKLICKSCLEAHNH